MSIISGFEKQNGAPLRLLYLTMTLGLLFQCQVKGSFTELENFESIPSNVEFSEYCQILDKDIRDVEVVYNFYGDERRKMFRLEQQQKHEPMGIGLEPLSSSDSLAFLTALKTQLKQAGLKESDEERILTMIQLIQGDYQAELVFEGANLVNAQEFIINEAGKYHFLLINEAHHSAQHRVFTTKLLSSLWHKGYRYLALEALAFDEFKINERGFPLLSSGSYMKDPSFGNMVREALKIGFQVIPYEFSPTDNSVQREIIQANNIIERTWKNDSIGKVVVHAGYGHISKTDNGIDNSLMGYYLEQRVPGNVLSVDQQSLSYVGKINNHAYYTYLSEHWEPNVPIVAIKNSSPIIDPVNKRGIDIQVFHPKPKLVNGRADWLLSRKGLSPQPLPNAIKSFQGKLLVAQYKSESKSSVPLDQFIIDGQRQLYLPSGVFILSIVNCQDIIESQFLLEVK